MEDSIKPYDESTGHTWVEGDGIKMKSGNYLVRNAYQYGDDVNAFKWDRKAKNLKYFEKVKAASLLRNAQMGNLFGRAYSEIKDRKVNNVFDSIYWDGADAIVACYLQGKQDKENYYLIVGGRLNSQWGDLKCGVQKITNIFSSTDAHTAGESFTMESEVLGTGKFEVYLCKGKAI